MNRISAEYLVVSLIIGTVACSDGSPSAPEAQVVPSSPAGLVISNPHPNSTTARVNGTHASLATSAEPNVALVSMEPGSQPDALSVAVRNITLGGAARSVDVIDGGFDPVAVEARVGDEIELKFLLIGGGTRIVTVRVPPRRPPEVVRTNPSRGRVDVALNYLTLEVVFSEPIDVISLTTKSLQLLKDGKPVSGRVGLGGNTWEAEFVADNSFDPQSTYEIVVTTAIRDLDGEVLPEEYRSTFTTSLNPSTFTIRGAFIYTEAEGMIAIGTNSFATAIDDLGQVVGSIAVGSQGHPFLWSRTRGMIDLGILPGTSWSVAKAINHEGQVVGYGEASSSSSFHVSAWSWTQATGMVNLEWPRNPFSYPFGVDSKGQIVGDTYPQGNGLPGQAFRWTATGGMQYLPTGLGEERSGALAINDAGQVAGYILNPDSWSAEFGEPGLTARAVVWNAAGITEIASCGRFCFAIATAVSRNGQVAGNIGDQAFRWTPAGGVSILAGLPGATSSGASGINDLGQVVGRSHVGSNDHAVLWNATGQVRDIGTLPGKSSSTASAINNKGEIVGGSW